MGEANQLPFSHQSSRSLNHVLEKGLIFFLSLPSRKAFVDLGKVVFNNVIEQLRSNLGLVVKRAFPTLLRREKDLPRAESVLNPKKIKYFSSQPRKQRNPYLKKLGDNRETMAHFSRICLPL